MNSIEKDIKNALLTFGSLDIVELQDKLDLIGLSISVDALEEVTERMIKNKMIQSKMGEFSNS